MELAAFAGSTRTAADRAASIDAPESSRNRNVREQ
jgi:hypothetical protein